jgi:glycosyltransferase
MKFSIIIPNYNDNKIARTLSSIEVQAYDDVEVIIIEGGSSPDVLEIYKKYEDLISILIIEKDKGIFDALNKGIKSSSGDFIFLIGSDDYLEQTNILKKIDEQSKIHQEESMFCIGCKFINADGDIKRVWNLPKRFRFNLGILPPHFSLFIHKSVYKKVGLFDINFSSSVACDTDWLLRLGRTSPSIRVIPDLSVVMELGGTSTGSISNILKAFYLTMLSAFRHGYTFFIFIPFIKVLTKIGQLK